MAVGPPPYRTEKRYSSCAEPDATTVHPTVVPAGWPEGRSAWRAMRLHGCAASAAGGRPGRGASDAGEVTEMTGNATRKPHAATAGCRAVVVGARGGSV